MSVTAQSIIKNVVIDTLVDYTSVRWPIDEIARIFNDGQLDICVHRPDAQVVTASIALAAGTKQTLPTGATKLIDIPRNTAGNKRSITKCPMSLLNEQIPNWHGLTGVTEILHFMYDERDDRTFYVYPPAAGSGSPSVEATYAALPTDITIPATGGDYTTVTGNMSLPDIFANALKNYIAYRCYAKDSETASNASRATAHYQLYANDLGIELKATQGVMPVTAPNLRPRGGG